MKRAVLICPESRAGLEDLAGGVPLVLAVYLGKPFIDHALHGLALEGFKEALVFASDRPAEIREYIGSGSAWGLGVEVIATPRELTADEAGDRPEVIEGDQVAILDRLPQAPEIPVLGDAASWHRSRADLLPRLAPGQIGTREIAPGIWAGLKARIAPTAKLEAPCWIGHQATIGAEAEVGPNGFVESDSVVEAKATVSDSTLGARTYLGSLTHLADSVAAGAVLANWRTVSVTRIADAFLLSHLDPPREAATSFHSRLLALLVLLLTLPVPFIALLLAPLRRRRFAERRCTVLRTQPGEPARSVCFLDFPSLPGAWSRWPRLVRIVTGHFAWTGNPPLLPEEITTLRTEFERLWLVAPPGFFTAPEAEGCVAPWDDDARAHAALFASRPTLAWRWRIVRRGLKSLLTFTPHASCKPNKPATPSVSPASPN